MTDSKIIFRKEISSDKREHDQLSVTSFDKAGGGAPVLLSAYHGGGDVCLYLTKKTARLLGEALMEATEEIERYATQDPNDRIRAEGPSSNGEVGAGSTLPS